MTPGVGPEPFVGLRPYGPEDVARFFGRSRESWQLTSLVLSSRFVVVYGPAGVGKTSLVQAGVVPGLRQEGAIVLPVGRLPRASALPPLETAGANPYTVALLAAWAPDADPTWLPQMTLLEVLAGIPVEVDDFGDPLPLVAVVDSFEEAFTGNPLGVGHRDELLGQLGRAMAELDHLHLLIVTRQEAIGQLLPAEPKLFTGTRRRYEVTALDRAAALAAVTRSLEGTSRSFTPEAADDLVDRLTLTTFTDEVGGQRTVTTDSVEPTSLQVVCLALWRSLGDDTAEITADITARHLQEPGEVEATLTCFCAGAVMDVADREELPVRSVWEWLDRNFITDLGTRGMVHKGVASTGGMPTSVAEAFEHPHLLLQSEKRLGSVWFELQHDVLVEPIRYGRRLADRMTEGVEAVEGAPDSGPEAYLRMARIAVRDGQLGLGQEYAAGAVRASEDDARAHAEANVFLGELIFTSAQAASPEAAPALYASAEEKFQVAAQLFEAERDPEAAAQQLAQLGRIAMETGRYAESLQRLRGAIQRTRGDVAISLDFARALRLAGQRGAAAVVYTAVLDTAAGTVDALVERGILAAEHGDAARALRDLDAAIERDPGLARRPDVAAARNHALSRVERVS